MPSRGFLLTSFMSSHTLEEILYHTYNIRDKTSNQIQIFHNIEKEMRYFMYKTTNRFIQHDINLQNKIYQSPDFK